MADQGLFGLSPWEVQQAQQAAQQQNMMDMSAMDATRLGKYGMLSAGSGLGGLLAQKMGGRNVAVENAQRSEQLMGAEGTDLSTSAGMMAKANEFRQAGDLRMAGALMMKANELKKQEAAAALAAQKQAFDERKFDEGEKEKIRAANEFRLQQLAQQAEIAKQRSEDSRYSADARLQAAQEAAQARRDIAAMMDQMRRDVAAAKGSGIEKPLTAAQQAKQSKEMAQSSSAIRTQDMEIKNVGKIIDDVIQSPGLAGATGLQGVLPSYPGSAASVAEGNLKSIENRLKAQGLKVLREGGGIGAITEKEWDILANQVANIDRSKGAEFVKGELAKVQATMLDMQRNAMQRHYEQFGQEYSTDRTGGTPPGTPPVAPPATKPRTFKVLGKE